MSNESKSQDTQMAEEFVEATRNRLERSYKNNVIVTIVVLSLVTLYFVLLNRMIVDVAIDVAGDFTEHYEGDVKKYTKLTQDSLMVANAMTDPDKAPGLALRILAEQTDAAIASQGVSWDNWISNLKGNLKNIPEWANDEETYKIGENMERRVKNWTLQVLQDTTTELGETIDAYLENNKDTIAKFAEDTGDETALNALADGLQGELIRFMDETEITNKGTLADQSRNVLIKLQRASEILEELAEKDHKELNREQRQLRLAIALMMEGAQNLEIPGDGSQ